MSASPQSVSPGTMMCTVAPGANDSGSGGAYGVQWSPTLRRFFGGAVLVSGGTATDPVWAAAASGSAAGVVPGRLTRASTASNDAGTAFLEIGIVFSPCDPPRRAAGHGPLQK